LLFLSFVPVDVTVGDLPELTWIEPSYYNVGNSTTKHYKYADDQHPDHDVSLGDQLIKDIYDSLRASPLWNKSALIITYDEHGGFFDHVPPLDKNVPSPDGINCTDDPFDFTRIGVRVPTIVISPWVKKGQVIHAPSPVSSTSNGQYEHSSFPATIVHKLFQPIHPEIHPKPSYLTARDEWAATFESVFTSLKHPRDDCPLTTPAPSREVHQLSLPPQDGSMKLSDFQKELLFLAASLKKEGEEENSTFSSSSAFDYTYASEHWNEAQAAAFITEKMNHFFGFEIVPV
jgi:phospholipase C